MFWNRLWLVASTKLSCFGEFRGKNLTSHISTIQTTRFFFICLIFIGCYLEAENRSVLSLYTPREMFFYYKNHLVTLRFKS